MKRPLAIGALVAACAVCCAIPFLLPAIGLGLFGGGLLLGLRWDQILCAVGAVLVVAIVTRSLRAPKPKACSTDGSCGCKATD